MKASTLARSPSANAAIPRVEIIDLTRVMDENLPLYSEGDYSDPPFRMETWCSIPEQGFQGSRLSLGTQTGTHIDAPAHFVTGGTTLDELPIQYLIGPYLWVDLDDFSPAILEKSGGKDQHILFLTGSSQVEISQKTFHLLLKLPCRVWVTVHEIRIAGQEPLYFHKTLFKASKYLVEDIDETQGSRVKPGGEIVILPLRLKEAVGSPCRVVVRQKSP